MKNRRRVTEEDLLITEALIAQSYGQLKQSVVQVPTRAYQSLGQMVREHPFESAGTAVVGGAAMYGIIKMMTSRAAVQETQERERVTKQKDTCRPDLMHDMMLMILPMVTPYIAGYIQKYLGTILSGERD
ncbi:MAG: hypothetical protein NTV84_03935 [Methanoregula sp.]|nr:hypothetical protein [Methanoregula sp.]